MQARSSFTRAFSLGYACGFIGLFFSSLPVCFIIVSGTLLRSRSPSAGGPFPGHAPSPEAHQPIRLGLSGGPRHRPPGRGGGVHFFFSFCFLGCPRPESQDPARAGRPDQGARSTRPHAAPCRGGGAWSWPPRARADPASVEGALSRKIKQNPQTSFNVAKSEAKRAAASPAFRVAHRTTSHC